MKPVRAMPLFLRVILFFAAGFSLSAAAMALLGLAGQLDYSIGGYASNREEWLRFALPVWVFLSAAMGAVAFALWTRRKWVRHLILLMWSILGVYALGLYVTGNLSLVTMVSTFIRVLVFAAFCIWYFYFKPNVAAYFAAL